MKLEGTTKNKVKHGKTCHILWYHSPCFAVRGAPVEMLRGPHHLLNLLISTFTTYICLDPKVVLAPCFYSWLITQRLNIRRRLTPVMTWGCRGLKSFSSIQVHKRRSVPTWRPPHESPGHSRRILGLTWICHVRWEIWGSWPDSSSWEMLFKACPGIVLLQSLSSLSLVLLFPHSHGWGSSVLPS